MQTEARTLYLGMTARWIRTNAVVGMAGITHETIARFDQCQHECQVLRRGCQLMLLGNDGLYDVDWDEWDDEWDAYMLEIQAGNENFLLVEITEEEARQLERYVIYLEEDDEEDWQDNEHEDDLPVIVVEVESTPTGTRYTREDGAVFEISGTKELGEWSAHVDGECVSSGTYHLRICESDRSHDEICFTVHGEEGLRDVAWASIPTVQDYDPFLQVLAWVWN